MSDVTRILCQVEQGDPEAAEKLLPLVYEELRQLAAAKLAQEKPGQTLQATALVHEAYLRLVGNKLAVERPVAGRREFMLAAAQAMRRILIERARGKAALKRGGQRQRIDLESLEPAEPETADELLALHAALQRLESVEPQAAELVQLRYFGGCTMEEAANLLGISLRSGNRLWAYAKAWLLEELAED
jgi:RNA polymerase sigma factor (TIGR02999 family)